MHDKNNLEVHQYINNVKKYMHSYNNMKYEIFLLHIQVDAIGGNS